MSFLSILLFASTFYFAHAKPNWPSMLPTASVPIMESAYQENLGGFMLKMGEAVEEYVTPLMSQLDLSKQDKLKTMGMNGFANYVNYLLLLIQEQEAEDARWVDDEDHEDYDYHHHSPGSRDPKEMPLEYDSTYSFDEVSPYVAAASPDE